MLVCLIAMLLVTCDVCRGVASSSRAGIPRGAGPRPSHKARHRDKQVRHNATALYRRRIVPGVRTARGPGAEHPRSPRASPARRLSPSASPRPRQESCHQRDSPAISHVPH